MTLPIWFALFAGCFTFGLRPRRLPCKNTGNLIYELAYKLLYMVSGSCLSHVMQTKLSRVGLNLPHALAGGLTPSVKPAVDGQPPLCMAGGALLSGSSLLSGSLRYRKLAY